ncbi:MAG: stage II sporulation protein M [Archaeoglobaceae archaeon]|nr:stage II sporulation protein M [Archaeoglobales archaeon]MDI9643482.1 stage II sporulation protein M [Archaeoglobales archaeon]
MEVRLIFVMLSAFFLFSAYFGYLIADLFPELAKKEIESIQEFLKDFASNKNSPVLIFLLILVNNSVKSFIAMLLGIFFGVIPLLFLFINGIVIGILAKIVGEKIGLGVFLLLLLPHGILEIPAVILACSYGFWLGIEFLKDRKTIRGKLKYSINRFLKVVLPMLIIAAFVETALIILT